MLPLRSISFSGVSFTELQDNPRRLGEQMFANIQNVTCPNDLRKYVPVTASMVFNYIADRAQSNMLRAIHYNIAIAQNFNNPEIAVLTTFVLNLSFIKLRQNQYASLDQAVMETVPWVVDRRINFITISDASMSAMAGNTIEQVRAFATEYVTQADAVEQILQNTFTGGTVNANTGQMGFGNNQGQQNSFGFSESNNQQGMLGGFSSVGGGFSQGGGQGLNQGGAISGFSNFGESGLKGFGPAKNLTSSPSSVITRVDSNGQGMVQNNRFQNDIVPGALNRAKPKAPDMVEPHAPAQFHHEVVQKAQPVPAPVKAPDAINADGTVNTALLATTENPWVTSVYQRYAIAYDTRRFGEVKKLLSDPVTGKNIVITSLKKVIEMDRSAHALPSSERFLNQVMAPSSSSRKEFKESSLKAVTQNLKEARSPKVESDYIARLDSLRSVGHIVLKDPVYSVQEAITYARLSALTYTGNEFGAYQLEFKLVREFPIQASDIADVSKLSSYKTFHSLASKIRGVIEDELAPQSLRTAMVQINAYLAERFLDFIRFYLCIDNFIQIDSFIDDVNDIIEEIGTVYGATYKDNLLSAQERFITSNLNFKDAKLPVIETDAPAFLHGEDPGNAKENKIALLPIETACMVTCTEFLDSEYSLFIPENIGAQFTADTTSKGLFELVEQSLVQPFSIGLQTKLQRFFIATLDNRVYEANMGLAKGAAPLLIKKYK